MGVVRREKKLSPKAREIISRKERQSNFVDLSVALNEEPQNDSRAFAKQTLALLLLL